MVRTGVPGHLTWGTTQVGGRRVVYGSGGQGVPVLFLQGWGPAAVMVQAVTAAAADHSAGAGLRPVS